MVDKSFDVVIVGGGNKALIAAMYLTKYGKLSVGIFEERHELGGGWCQEEPAPGFLGNPCSTAMTAQYHIPIFWDFPEWEDYGVKMDYTKCGAGAIFSEDDTCLVQYTAFPDVDPDQEKTAAEIARFSRKDADTYLRLWKNLKNKWEPYFLEAFFNPPPPGQPDAIDRMVQQPDSGLDPSWFLMSPIQMNKTLWEDPHVRHAFGRLNQSLGFEGDQAGSGFMANIGTSPYYTAHQCRNYAPTGNWCVIDNIPSQSGRFRPVAELARNKVPGIEGLYCTGSAWPPYGSAHSMQGYNCYKIMAEDLHLPKPWDVDGRPF